jgi:hypothetical protein
VDNAAQMMGGVSSFPYRETTTGDSYESPLGDLRDSLSDLSVLKLLNAKVAKDALRTLRRTRY